MYEEIFNQIQSVMNKRRISQGFMIHDTVPVLPILNQAAKGHRCTNNR